MIITINLNLLKEIQSTDLLTYLALLLAYAAYIWSVNRDFQSWKSLFISFKSDLESQKSWLGTEYFGWSGGYEDKNSYNPYKIIFPLSFESLPEIIRRGVAEFAWISKTFVNNLSLFNERVIAFNSLLDQIKKGNSANPISTEKLKDKLNGLGLDKESVGFNELKKKIFENKQSDEILYLAESNRRLNKIVHVHLIGNKTNEDKLHYLYSEITRELENILDNFEKKKPWFIKHNRIIILLSVIIFICVEVYL